MKRRVPLFPHCLGWVRTLRTAVSDRTARPPEHYTEAAIRVRGYLIPLLQES